MKTVEEACLSTFVYKYDNKTAKPPMEQIQDQIRQDVEHWRGVDDEIRNCCWVHVLIAQMIAMVASGQMPLGEALMAIAVQFTAVGIEMERPELQPLPMESVPGRREGYTGV